MYFRIKATVWLSFILIGTPSFALDKSAAYQEIKDMLPVVCGSFDANGNSKSLSVKADAEANVNGLLRKLADLGVKGATEFNSDSYVGV